MKKKIKNVAANLWGVLPFSPKGVSIPILCYHSVNDSQCEEADPIPLSLFEGQLRYLKNYHNVITLKQVVDHLINGKSLPERPVAITFDDGYIDNYIYAFPLLKKYDLPATIFVVSAFLNQEIQLIPVNGWGGLSWEQAREMIASGLIDFEAHTHNHIILTENDREQVEIEIQNSRDNICRELGVVPEFFAYPNGQGVDIPDYSGELLESLGFRAAFSTFWRTWHLPKEIMEINRVMINGSDDLDVFRQKVQGAYDYIYYLHKIKAVALIR